MLICLCSLTALAADFTFDDINYNITSTEKQTVEVAGGIPYEGDFVIPDKVEWNGNEYSVTGIGEGAFAGCSRLTSITIPNSVTSIGSQAFIGCFDLTEIVSLITEPFPIDQNVWGGVVNPGKILLYVPVGTKELYYTTDGWKNFIIYEWGKEFPVGGFDFKIISMDEMTVEITRGRDWPYEGDIVIPETIEWKGIDFYVTGIGNDGFLGCSEMTSITIPNSVTYIGDYAFDYCSGLTSIIIPNSVTTIGNNAFAKCSGLSSITIPNSVSNIGDYAFYLCSELTSITIPNSVTTIGHDVFANCI
ncbi:MAG: leucine-rich repeat protein [Prevotella sp.]|nr:leucine-rich repeat protein [Prevotella sp.]